MSIPRFSRTLLRLHQLEERLAPAVFQVTAIGDTGAGTLREAIGLANANADADTITFSSLFNTTQTILLTSDQLLVSNPVTITGPGASLLTVRRDPNAATNFRIFEVNGTGVIAATISGMTITGGNTSGTAGGGPGGDGAGLVMLNDTVTLDGVAITGNTSATEGGGIAVASVNSGGAGSLTIRNSTISGNTSNGNPGASFGGAGGGIYFANGGGLLIQNCTISGNTSTNSQGGALYFYGSIGALGCSILNSTISGNTSATNAGGAYIGTITGNALVQNSTIANNAANGATAVAGGLGRFGGGSGVLSVVSTIIANNTVAAGGTGPDVAGAITASFSLIRDPSGATITDGGNNLMPTNPMLLPLANNGGPTQTMALEAASPAINAGSNPSGFQFDQRGTGFPRSVGQTDIGAYEFLPPGTPTGSAMLANVTAAGGALYTFQVTFTDETAINVSTLGNGDLRVTGPNGYNQLAAFVSVDPNMNGTPLTATYTVPAPNGTFAAADNGTYQVSIEPSQVADTGGNFVPAGVLGSFQVLIAATFTVTNANDDLSPGSLRAVLQQANEFSTADTIVFGPLFNTAQTISLSSRSTLFIGNPVTITGPGANLLTVTRDAGAPILFRIFVLDAPGIANISLSGMTISGGRTEGGGGGGPPVGDGAGLLMFNDNVTLDSVVITGNIASAEGGGITVASVNSGGAGNLIVRNSTVSGNTASGNVDNYSGGGGGIYLANGGSLHLENSTISGNTSTFGRGGGVYFFGTVNANGFTIINSTITGNSANRNGGGVYLNFTGAAQILNSTITGNTAVVAGGGVGIGGTTAQTTIISSVISDNTGLVNDLAGPATVSFSLIRDQSGATITDGGNNLAAGTDPGFANSGVPANNGGPTQTIALQAGSPLLNLGSNPANLTTDQRGPGFARLSGTGVDIGAFERQVATAPTVTSTSVNGGATQRSRVTSIAVTFSQQVTFAGAVGNAFTLTRTGGGAVNFNASAATVGGVTVVTLDGFTGAETDSGSLRDGRYTLTALAAQITAGGLQLNNGTNFTFGDPQGLFRFFGDSTADRRVDIADFGFFSLAYLTPANYNAALDFNNDGRIDIADFGQFSVRYFTTLP